ncbi:hypothetical protein KIW84_070807 [Lathyrus oleraceus]|uniref:Reverse transcriptase domain-containing protein n=1 Tax=Pisum sativum TaxID=3888 RepID=A0A9D4VGN3_PEA|nr:hypothetical protein KIW84_070807 [Pisum sativum]
MNRPPPEKAPVTFTEHMDDGESGEKNRNRNKEGNKNFTAVLQGPVVNNGQGGVLVSSSKCNIFMEQINMCKLIDINIIGHKFTWSGPIFHGGHTTYEILDMALCNDDWSLDFPEAQLKILTRVEFSDYHSILINLNKVKIINADKIFHFESAWVLRDKFHEEFEKAWRKKDSMMDNLRDVKEDIIYWKSKTFD